METVEIQVGIGSERQTVEVPYTPRELQALPFSLSHQAVLVAEMRWMQRHLSAHVREAVAELYVTKFGPVRTLANHVSGLGELRIEIVALIDGLAHWEMELACDACDGSGETLTIKGREVVCPDCDGEGYTTGFEFRTDVSGRFVGYEGAGVRNLLSGTWPSQPVFEMLPLSEALAVTERWWA